MLSAATPPLPVVSWEHLDVAQSPAVDRYPADPLQRPRDVLERRCGHLLSRSDADDLDDQGRAVVVFEGRSHHPHHHAVPVCGAGEINLYLDRLAGRSWPLDAGLHRRPGRVPGGQRRRHLPLLLYCDGRADRRYRRLYDWHPGGAARSLDRGRRLKITSPWQATVA